MFKKQKNFWNKKVILQTTYIFFKNIQLWQYGTLINVFTDNDAYTVFRRKEDGAYYEYFIPESSLLEAKQKESKYVPFETTHDLAKGNFHTGDTIDFMNKKFPEIIHRAIITEVNCDEIEERLIDITLGSTTYSFNTLCDEYMYLNAHLKWVPFGVEE